MKARAKIKALELDSIKEPNPGIENTLKEPSPNGVTLPPHRLQFLNKLKEPDVRVDPVTRAKLQYNKKRATI